MTFKTKTRYYVKLFIPETIKLFPSTENKTTKDKNNEKCASFRDYISNITSL